MFRGRINIGGISFILIIVIFSIWLIQYINTPVWEILTNLFGITEINKTISIEYMLTSIGAVIVFWYGYRNYERDKELDILERYGNRYDNIGEEKYFNKLINLWSEELWLYDRGYITNKLWLRIESKIELNLSKLIVNIDKEVKVLKGKEKNIEKLTEIFQNSFDCFSSDEILYHKTNLGKYIIGRLVELEKTYRSMNLSKLVLRGEKDIKNYLLAIKILKTLIEVGLKDSKIIEIGIKKLFFKDILEKTKKYFISFKGKSQKKSKH